MRGGRITQVSIRLTEEERERIRRYAERAHQKEAVFIRNIALGKKEMIIPKELEERLRQLLDANLSVAKDINQAARSCREKGSFSADQYRELTGYLERLNGNYEKMNEQIREVISNGNHEVAPPEGK